MQSVNLMPQEECYIFNDKLPKKQDDGKCIHCKYFLTLQCEHIDEFLEEVDELEDVD